ncbi:hypothetical protein F53441_11089 [Fusarium austroafricanum]|uniref:Uncharacterized protein n=1 Tax=Fusarium austroafricanum TaxID=2364996 RepID=A0A8H4NU74_9HYPO|nr:hypothetical protein F53441_11089 [Fusarium austroafricanum]
MNTNVAKKAIAATEKTDMANQGATATTAPVSQETPSEVTEARTTSLEQKRKETLAWVEKNSTPKSPDYDEDEELKKFQERCDAIEKEIRSMSREELHARFPQWKNSENEWMNEEEADEVIRAYFNEK